MAVEERVKTIIVEQLGVDADEVTPEASFVEDLGADSLDTVELIMAFEEEFGVEISRSSTSRSAPRRPNPSPCRRRLQPAHGRLKPAATQSSMTR